ncbi:hypothetical protein NMG60_11008921 [Bertholletia excelsa]
MSLSNSAASNVDLRQRVISCLNKLSDRDTLTVATNELEFIARNLTHEAFSPFLSCLSATDSSEKSPVRRQCVRLLGFLSAAHGDALAPHLSKMLSAVLRRLRDSDSAVRSSCVDAVGSMASKITKPPFSSFLKPLVDAIFHEQDYNSQIGSALCLAAAIESSPDPEPAQLLKLLPRLLKLVKNDCFKAKPALLSLIGSIASAGGASNRNVLAAMVPCLVEFLSSEDWAARKAAAEALSRLAVAERGKLSEFRSSCVASLEGRRFDKVKVVRDIMNRTLELWKVIPGVPDEILSESKCKSSGEADSVECSPPTSRSSCDDNFQTPKPKKAASRLSLPEISSVTTFPRESPSRSGDTKPNSSIFNKLDCEKRSDCNSETAASRPSFLKVACKDDLKDGYLAVVNSEMKKGRGHLKSEPKHIHFSKSSDEKLQKFGGFRSGSRVVPFQEIDDYRTDAIHTIDTEDGDGNQKDAEDLNLIREQLLQIENQQSSLLDLLQRFIGSSQSGMNSLETRVNGLEKVLDEISYDLAMSGGRISNTDSSGNRCCLLPNTEFLSPKFWRRTEGQYSSSRFSSTGRNHALKDMRTTQNQDTNFEKPEVDSPKDWRCQGEGKFAASPLLAARRNLRGSLESCSNKNPNKITKDTEKIKVFNTGGFDGTLPANCISAGSIKSRSSA